MKRLFAFLCLLALTPAAMAASSEETITLPSGTAVTSQRYTADREAAAVVLWFTGQYGRLEEEQRAAEHLAKAGMEVWLTDWLAPYFLPQVAQSVRQVPDADLADWLAYMRARHAERPLVLVASGQASALALRAAAAWQARSDAPSAVAGAVLLWPLLYQDPEPGEEPQYDAVVALTRLDLVLLVPMSSAGYWWRDAMQAAFEAAGSRVRVVVLPGLRDRFYHRSDADAQEQAAGARLGELLAPHITSLIKEPTP
jgi:alpha-beta hydrolase superfamily lysophospholipase